MGKNKMFKQLRKEASRTKMEFKEIDVGVRSKGEELLNQGIKEVGGQPVKSDLLYKGKATMRVPVNHARALKRAYYAKGENGAVEYLEKAEERAKPAGNLLDTSNQINTEGAKNISWPGM